MKKLLVKTFLVSSLLTFPYLSSQAQSGVEITFANNDVNFSGKTSSTKNNSDYLLPGWNKGAVRLSNDSIYRNLDLIYDIANNRPIFKSDNGQAQMFKLGVKEFSINIPVESNSPETKIFKNGFPPIEGGDATTFYEVLSEGKATLLKRIQIKLVEERTTGTILSVKQKQQFYTYFLVTENKITAIKKDKKQLLSILNQTKREALDNYITSNKLNVKKDEELSKVFDYYNAL